MRHTPCTFSINGATVFTCIPHTTYMCISTASVWHDLYKYCFPVASTVEKTGGNPNDNDSRIAARPCYYVPRAGMPSLMTNMWFLCSMVTEVPYQHGDFPMVFDITQEPQSLESTTFVASPIIMDVAWKVQRVISPTCVAKSISILKTASQFVHRV